MESRSATEASVAGSSETSAFFESVVHHSIEAVIIGTPDGHLVYANPAACEMFGGPEEQLRELGQAGITDPEHPVWRRMTEERRRTGRARGIAPMLRLDGTPLLAQVSSAGFYSPEGVERACIILRDVTREVRHERDLAAYNEVVEALLRGAATADVMALLARHARIVFDATDATVVTTADPPDDVVISAADGPTASNMLGHAYGPGTTARRVMETQEPVLIEQLAGAAPMGEGHSLGPGTGMVAPIVSGKVVYGVLFVGVATGRPPYRGDDLVQLAQFAGRSALAIAIGEARAESERQQRRLNQQLQHALHTRIVIEQAKGVILATRRVPPEEAFQRLRAYARSHNQDVHITARAVVDGKLLL